MLRELHVRNLAVLAGASVTFQPGLNALTGETGAGKSIVVDSLMLLAGARASSDLIRTGADVLTVTGSFEPSGSAWRSRLEEAGVAAEGAELIVRREVSRSGRNRVFINDQPTTLRLLSELAPWLLRIHGQREELGLVEVDLQRQWLDRSGGEEADVLCQRAIEAFDAYRELAGRLERLVGDEGLRLQRLDLLNFQAREIDAAGLQPGEEENLRAEREVLRHSEAIGHALGGSFSLLSEDEGAAVERLGKSQELLEEIIEWEPQATAWCQELEELRIRAEELAHTLRSRLEEVEPDPQRLNSVEDRLAALERLFRKYAASSEEILSYRQQIEVERQELEGDVENREELEERVAAALDVYRTAAVELSAARRHWGEELSRRIKKELAELALSQAKLAVELERRPSPDGLQIDGQEVEFGRHGIDRVVFLFSPNPGEELRPLSRVASGGELSRLSLALLLAVHAGGDSSEPTLVFDEVDAGIGGAQAAALGRKLQQLGQDGQILVVTHLPQVASHADHHFRVSKEVRGGQTYAQVEPLEIEERVEEVARMLAGKKVTDTSRSHAQELITGAARSAS